MSISFRKNESDLVLVYVPDIADMGSIASDLSKGNTVRLRKTFHLKLVNLLSQYTEKIAWLGTEKSEYLEFDDALHFDKLEFIIGQYIGDYVFLNKSILDINHQFSFSNSIDLKARLFVADHNISIPKKMSTVFNSDIFIGGDEAQLGYVSFSDYELLVKKFPTTTELKYYSNYRVELLLSDYFDDKIGFSQKYQKYISSKKSISFRGTRISGDGDFISSALYQSTLHKLEQFTLLLRDFKIRLTSGSYTEGVWQQYIQKIIFMIFPKYILAPREITFEAINEIEDPHQRRPDFVLIDTNGFVDVMDIKVPEVSIISSTPSYRNNHIPSKVFSSAIQQVEKYVYCLNQRVKENQDKINNRVRAELPDDIHVRIITPLGLLILGRSEGLTPSQLRDLELIKRQYKHVVEVLTYDDILARLQNIVKAIERELN